MIVPAEYGLAVVSAVIVPAERYDLTSLTERFECLGKEDSHVAVGQVRLTILYTMGVGMVQW
jgi:hypothetical protein